MNIEKIEYPEGGYGWFIVLASFLLHFVLYGLPYSYGVFLKFYLKSSFKDQASPFIFSLIGSAAASLITICGFITGRLADRYGYRNMALLGSIIFVISYILASFSNKVWQLLIFQGLIAGIGSSIGILPGVSIPSHYFFKRRGLITGICVSGAGIGGLAFTLISQKSLDSLGIAWTLRLVALISFMLAVPSAFILRERIPPTPRTHLLDFSLFKNIQFTTLWVGGIISNLGILIPLFMLPLYASEHKLTASQGVILVAILNGGNAIGRIVLGFLADRWDVLDILIVGIVLSGLSTLLIWFFATTFPVLVLFCCIFGLVYCSYICLLSIISAKLFGLKNISSTNGLLSVSFGIPCFLGFPIATLLLEYGFTAVILFSGISTLTGSLFIIHLKYQINHKKSNTEIKK